MAKNGISPYVLFYNIFEKMGRINVLFYTTEEITDAVETEKFQGLLFSTGCE
jgi:hypothetical protein